MANLLMFTKLERNPNIQQWLVIVLISAIGFLNVLAIHGWPNNNCHQSILKRMRAVDPNFVSLTRNALYSAGFVNSYGSLTKNASTRRNDLDHLKRLLGQPNIGGRSRLTGRLMQLKDASIVLKSDTETLNSHNLSINALFTNKAVQSRLNNNPNVRTFIFRSVGVGNVILQYNTGLRNQAKSDYPGYMPETIIRITSPQIELRMQVHFSSEVPHSLPRQFRAISTMQPSKFTNIAHKNNSEYVGRHERGWYLLHPLILGLGGLSCILLIYVVILVYVLRAQAEKLRRRLQYETMLKDVDRVFANHRNRVRVPPVAQIHTGIEIINAFFAGTHYELVLVDPMKREIVNRFASRDLVTHQSDDVLLDMASQVQILDDDTRCVTRVSSKNRTLHMALRNGGILAVIRLGYSTSLPRIASSDLNLLEDSFKRLVNNFGCQQIKDEHQILRRRLEHVERLQIVGTMAGGIAHEFNNILGTILGYAEMAHDSSMQSVSNRRYIERIIDASHRARHIIDQILAMSRKPERITHPINITHVVERTVPLLRVTLPSSVELSLHMEADKNVIEANPIEVQQILLNLCKNAADALDGSGQIDIYITQTTLVLSKALYNGEIPPGDYVVLSVVDTGSGVPEGLVRQIFEPFFTTKSRAGGTGLGLATVLQHVNGLGGFIDVMSSAYTGTRFDIYLPRSRKEAVELSTFFHDKRLPLGKGEIVAILEADPATLRVYEDKVAMLGYEPVGFISLDALMSWIKLNNEPDLIMLGQSSLGLHQTIGSFRKTMENTPLVVIGELENTAYSYDAASTSFLERTFSSKELAEVFRKHMANTTPH
ncbi:MULTISPECIES: ATP-binding protein [Rhizobium]|uniref:ATP-binding protein n=1 Tax=Rhizobium TaxID=379 RepID=UPI001C8346CB|nr:MULTISPECIES: ATP-binding protein [Rhizobium]MBX4899739.1 hypothetical protein [Rhizobium bangladeshense]MBX5297645.1 hypothetical protein [Rhizobium sp. NLR15a]MBY3617913.1 hypothetical protein [Rhizobium bangladeshense]